MEAWQQRLLAQLHVELNDNDKDNKFSENLLHQIGLDEPKCHLQHEGNIWLTR
jgi:hypothetical protein